MNPNDILDRIDRRFDRVDGRLDRQDERLDGISHTLITQGAVLEEHQRRSLANEKAVQLLQAELKPLALHVAVAGGLAKLIAVLGTLVALIFGIVNLIRVLR